MKILEVRGLAIPDVQVIRFARFRDQRGYFTEHFRKSDLRGLPFMREVDFVQCNESWSRTGTIRGLHFQWNPYMGKLVRTLVGRLVDLVLDIRKGSPTFGKIVAYDMPAWPNAAFSEWIWVPPGMAHGNFFTEDTQIEYFCSGEYNPACEAAISPFADDIDWSLCDPKLKTAFDSIAAAEPMMSEKDRAGQTVEAWASGPDSGNFVYKV